MESVVILILLLKNGNIKARSEAFYEENIKKFIYTLFVIRLN